jgi:PAS domain S-box-containing protein
VTESFLHASSRRDAHRPPQQALPAAWADALFERHPGAALLIDAEGRVLRSNPSAGWLPLTDGRQSTFSALMARPAPAELAKALSAGQPWTGRLQMKALDGTPRDVHAQVLPSADMRGPEARALCLLETDSAPVAPSIETGATAAHITVDSEPVMTWLSGCDSAGEWFNKAWCAYTGRSLEALRGRGWVQDVHPEDVERCLGIQFASFVDRQPYSMDYRLRRHDGEYRWMLANGVPRHADNGSFQGYTGICVDIHERKLLEERLAGHMQTLRLADRRQNEFLAMLSHELRGPLAPIANVASVLRALEDDNPKLTRLREIVERQVGRMRRLVDDLVDVTRVMQGQVTLVKQTVPVADLLRSAIETSQAKLDAGGHTLRITQPAAPVMVLGDAVRLSQALSNIISNAAKFSVEPGEISVAVTTAGDTVGISVRDNGPGIDADFLPYVFDLFAQQDQPRVRALGGLGLGLPLARRMAQLHGGDVRAASAGPDRGAEFVMSLPTLAAAVDGGTSASGKPPAPSASSYRVLLIEGNPDTRYLLKLQIELWGNQVQAVNDPAEALDQAESFQPEIVLCDLSVLGLGSTQWIREMGNRLGKARPLFAALAGHGRYEDEPAAKAAGFDAFVAKPLRPESLTQLFKARANHTA